MGGPCWCLKEVPEEKRTGRFQGPPCTDNFQIAMFEYNGVTYSSCEQAFQSLKFREGTSMRSTIAVTRPKHGETDSAHGMRCWQLGQSRSDPLVDQFEHVKVGLMYVVNVAKYVSNPRFKQDLIEKTGEWPLVGGRSTADWEKWNGLIHSLIREKIKNDADLHIELARDVSNLVEMKKLQVEMLALWKEPEAESESDSDAIYHQINFKST